MAGFVRFVLFVLVGALVVGTAQGIHPVLVSISGEVLPPFVVFGRRIDAGGHLANAMAVVLPMAGALLIEWLSTGGRYSSLSAMLRLATVRSHDQFNTTVYEENDRYRGIRGSLLERRTRLRGVPAVGA